MLRRRLVPICLLAALSALAVVVPASSGASAKSTPKKTFRIVDFKFSPGTATVASGTRVTWKWSKANVAAHNVHLIKAPKHVKHFTGGKGKHDNPTPYRKPFTVTLRKAGTYRFTCDIHTYMTLKIKVTK